MAFDNDDGACWLVFGLTGSIGRAFLARWRPGGGDRDLLALSRRAQSDARGLTWATGDLAGFAGPSRPASAIISLGPLDAFTDWFERSSLTPARVIAISSTSVHCKSASPDEAERALAARLHDAELRLTAVAQARGCALALLRPTLIYGVGADASLSRLVAIARRWRCLPLARGARGLRMPVHADDLAQAVLHCLRGAGPVRGAFDLAGGEAIPYDEMVARCLAVAAPDAGLLRVPDRLFRGGVRLLRAAGLLAGAGDGVLSRLGQDLVYDLAPAERALAYRPRPFRPEAAMFQIDAAAQQPEP